MRRIPFGLATMLIMAATSGQVSAQTWSDTLFHESSHDFGTVARGAKLRYTFWLVNTTNSDIRILNYRAKCGCTKVEIGATTVPPGTRTPIEATLDTTRFQGVKNSGLTLVLQGSSYAEKDLGLSCFIRGDVLLDPGVADFGVLGRNDLSRASVAMNLSYLGGQPGWQITGARTISDHVTAKITGHQSPGGGLQYQITATLNPGIPSGQFKDEITLLTNDSSSPTIPISVVANVQATVSVAPGNLVFGRVKAGQTITKPVMVRSGQNFKILGTNSSKTELTTPKIPDGEGTAQMLMVTFTAPSQPGPYHADMFVNTNLKDEAPAKFTAFATVEP